MTPLPRGPDDPIVTPWGGLSPPPRLNDMLQENAALAQTK